MIPNIEIVLAIVVAATVLIIIINKTSIKKPDTLKESNVTNANKKVSKKDSTPFKKPNTLKDSNVNNGFDQRNSEADEHIKNLNNSNLQIKYDAIKALANLRYLPATDPLIELLQDPDETTRSEVATCLGEIGAHQAVKPLISRLYDDPSGAVRSYTAGALGHIGDTEAVQPLLAVAFQDEDAGTRQDARTVLVQMFNWLDNESDTTENKNYYNEEWYFSLSFPSDWNEYRENEMYGEWSVPISVGKIVQNGWLKCMINVRNKELININSNIEILNIDQDEKASTLPRNVDEYIDQTKRELQANFPGFKLISTKEIKIDNKPAARIIYIRGEEDKKIYEEYSTLFDVGRTFLFVCEVPYSESKNYITAFREFVDSYKIGNIDTAKEISIPQTDKPVREDVEVFNQGVTFYRNGDFKQAIKAFEEGIIIGGFSLQSAYALCMSQKQLGMPIKLPSSFKGDTDAAGSVSLGTNIACHIIANGYSAAITETGEHTEVEAMYGSTKYLIHIDDILGQFMTNVWRIENGKEINIIDPDINPNPTEGDNYIRSITKKGTSLPLEFLPPEGLKDEL